MKCLLCTFMAGVVGTSEKRLEGHRGAWHKDAPRDGDQEVDHDLGRAAITDLHILLQLQQLRVGIDLPKQIIEDLKC
jgi:hypothetical protein